METQKRERSANFNAAKIQLLVSLVNKYKQIIENKKTDAVTNKDKERAWMKVENSFNSCGVASWKTLKLKYEGLKKGTKKKSSLQRQEMYRTGGGPSYAPEFNEVEEKVLSICSNITGMEPRNDCDTITNMNRSFILEIVEEDDSEKENKWDKWHPKALKTRVSNVLKCDTATKASVTSKLDRLSVARLELVQLQMEIARKEHQFIEEEHKLKMLHLANDERRKEEIHALLKQKMSCGPASSDMI